MSGDTEAADTLTKADVDQAPLLQRIPRAAWIVGALVVVGGGWFGWSKVIVPGMVRGEVASAMAAVETSVGELERCVVGEASDGKWLAAMILRTATEASYPEDLVACSQAFSSGLPDGLHDAARIDPDGPLGGVVASAGKLEETAQNFRSELASPKALAAAAVSVCESLAAVRTSLGALAEATGAAAPSGQAGACAFELEKLEQGTIPADILESRSEAVVDRGYRLGDGVVISYRAKTGGDLGILSYAVDGSSWELLSYDKGIHARPLWSKDLAWTVALPSPEANVPGKFLAHEDGAWQERAPLAAGVLPWRLVGGGDMLIVIGRPDTSPGANYLIQRSTDAGVTLGVPYDIGPPGYSLQPGTHVSADGTLTMVEADRRDTRLRFLARQLPPGNEVQVHRKQVEVDVGKTHKGPDPDLLLCVDGSNMWTLIGKRWILGSSDGGKDWKLVHTLEREHAHAHLQCHGDTAVVISNIEQTMRAGTRWTVCRPAGCAESALSAVRGVEVSTRLDRGEALLNVEFGDRHLGILFSDAALAGKPNATKVFELNRPDSDKRVPVVVYDDHAWLMSSLDPGWD